MDQNNYQFFYLTAMSKKYSQIHPRKVADKSVKQNLTDAINMSLQFESESVKRNTGVFNTNRYIATAKLNDYEKQGP